MDIDIREVSSDLNVDLLEKILDSELPPANKTDNEDYSELLADLLHFKIGTVGDLRALIERHRTAATREDAYRVSQLRKMEEDEQIADGGTPERTAKGVFYTHVGLTRTMIDRQFPKLWSKYQEDKLL